MLNEGTNSGNYITTVSSMFVVVVDFLRGLF